MPEPTDNWGEYSRLVLKELETLAQGVQGLQSHLTNIEREIAEIKARESRVKDLEDWKSRIDEIASPSQIRDMQKKVEELETFKTKAMTIFGAAQFIWGIVFAIFMDLI
jgi:predicted nuclease with TOPRIM domain